MLFLTDVVVVVLVVVAAALIAVVAVVVVFLAKFLAASFKSCQRLKTNATRLSSSSSFPACPASSRCKRGAFWRLLFRSLSLSLSPTLLAKRRRRDVAAAAAAVDKSSVRKLLASASHSVHIKFRSTEVADKSRG